MSPVPPSADIRYTVPSDGGSGDVSEAPPVANASIRRGVKSGLPTEGDTSDIKRARYVADASNRRNLSLAGQLMAALATTAGPKASPMPPSDGGNASVPSDGDNDDNEVVATVADASIRRGATALHRSRPELILRRPGDFCQKRKYGHLPASLLQPSRVWISAVGVSLPHMVPRWGRDHIRHAAQSTDVGSCRPPRAATTATES